MSQIMEVFLGFSIGVAILWVTVLALVKFTRRVMSGEEWRDVLKDLWKKRAKDVLSGNTKTAGTQPKMPITDPGASVSGDSRTNGQTRRKNLAGRYL
jgi:hypothetical protein